VRTLIFRTAAPTIVIVMLVFSVFVLLRGHNEPGGGFIGGLIAAAAIVVFGMAAGVEAVEKAVHVPPMAIAGFGVFMAALSGLPSLAVGAPYLTGLWGFVHLGSTEVPLSTPLLFDVGVYLAVFGTVSAVLLGLETAGDEP
jgi:multicomponent Na+:H+ antiporter subunit B